MGGHCLNKMALENAILFLLYDARVEWLRDFLRNTPLFLLASIVWKIIKKRYPTNKRLTRKIKKTNNTQQTTNNPTRSKIRDSRAESNFYDFIFLWRFVVVVFTASKWKVKWIGLVKRWPTGLFPSFTGFSRSFTGLYLVLLGFT